MNEELNTESEPKELKSVRKPPKLPKLRKLSRKTVAIIAVILVAAIIAGQFTFGKVFGSSAAQNITDYTVSKGDIKVVVSGSGTVEPVQQYNVVSLVKGDIIADHFSEGDKIEKGDLLYEIDSEDAQINIDKATLSLEKAQLSYDQALESIKALNVTSPISGVITEMNVKAGDSVNNNSAIATVVNMNSLTLKLPFLVEDAKRLYAGESAQVVLSESGESLAGKVSKISSGSYISSTGAVVSDVEITFSNPGSITEGVTATAKVGGIACNAAGTTSYRDKATIVAKTSGEVSKIYAEKGDRVSAGQTIVKLSSDSAASNADSAALSVKEAELSLQNSYDTLNNYKLTSPISGTVIQKNSKAGDTLDGSEGTVLAIIADMSSLTFTMDIDELDVSDIKVGQSVDVTADAISGKTFTGKVSKISMVGTSSNGVTSYPVTVTIDQYEGLRPGMNVNAEIVVQEKSDVLRIPVSAISRGNYVLLKNGSSSAKNAPSDSNSGPTSPPSDSAQFTPTSSVQVTSPVASDQAGKSGLDGNSLQQGSSSSQNSSGNSGSSASGSSGSSNSSSSSSGSSGNSLWRSGNSSQSSSGSSGSSSGSTARSSKSSVKSSGALGKLTAPDGYTYVRVTLGINDENYIEVVSGLKEGDVIGIINNTKDDTSSSSTKNQAVSMDMRMGMAAGGGEPPSGGPKDLG